MKKMIIIAILVLFIVSACSTQKQETKADMTVFKSPTCGCCVGWIGYMKQQDYSADTIPVSDMASVKRQHNIPPEMESCHTTEIGGYFIEGHVPVEAINKLLEERPDIDGIALPRMPSGSPGMPGQKTGTWVIYALKDGEYSEFMRI